MASAARRAVDPLALAALLATAAVLALAVDYPIAVWWRSHSLPIEAWRVVQFAEIFGHAFSLFIAAMLVWRLDPGWRRVMPTLLAATAAAGLSANLVKLFVERTRPNGIGDIESVWDTFDGVTLWGWLESSRESFPSGHVALAAGLAVSLARFYPRAGWLFALLVGLVMLQRIGVGAHYLSDVLAGAAMGTFVAELVARRIEQKRMNLELERCNAESS